MIDVNQITMDPQIQALVDKIADAYRRALSMNSRASGNLERFTASVELDNQGFSINFDLAPYWKYVEYGRKPGKQPPIADILKWIQVKPLVPRAINGKIPTTKALAFLIARSIGRKGIRGKHLLERTFNSSQPEIQQIKTLIATNIAKQLANIKII